MSALRPAVRTGVAYLINHYPAVSHSFIRCEILALERQRIDAQRISPRGWDGPRAGADNMRERERTSFVLREGALGLLGAVVAEAIAQPVAFLRNLRLATRVAVGSDRSLLYHWIYCAETCVVARWLRKASLPHLHAHFGTSSTEVATLASALVGATYSMTFHGPDEFDRPREIGLAEKIRRVAFVVGMCSFPRSKPFRWVESSHWDRVHVVHRGLDRALHLSSEDAAATMRVCARERVLERHDIDIEAGKLGRLLHLQLSEAVQ